MTTIAIIGAGNIGSQLARAAIAVGYDVVISNSRGPETLTDLIADLGSKARAASAAEAAALGDFAVVTIPLKNIAQVPVEPLAGKLVIDTNNYYPERDGHISELDNELATVTELLQSHLPTSTVIKGFNHVGAADITRDGRPANTPNRRALGLAGDNPDAKNLVAEFYDELGFDTVDVGPLSESWRIERDQPAYGVPQNEEELRSNVARATRDKNSPASE
ncbi:MAG: NAD(P)-binding domain-containing protein [Microbacteriaceae bacterium]|nr:NAD(P)-binding domain-containing protein [Microbacteriaceae bacterium]